MKIKTLRQLIEGMNDDIELRLYDDKDYKPVSTSGFTKLKDKNTGKDISVLILRTI